MVVRSLRNVEKQKKKARRALPRKKTTRIQGNTLRARRHLKKMAGKARPAKAAAQTETPPRKICAGAGGLPAGATPAVRATVGQAGGLASNPATAKARPLSARLR